MNDDLPQGWASAVLNDIAEIGPRHPKGLDDDMLVTFVPMAAISEAKPEFQHTEERPLGDVRKGFTHFAERDVLFAKITPCMENGKGAVARDCGISSDVAQRNFTSFDHSRTSAQTIFTAFLRSVRFAAWRRRTSRARQARLAFPRVLSKNSKSLLLRLPSSSG